MYRVTHWDSELAFIPPYATLESEDAIFWSPDCDHCSPELTADIAIRLLMEDYSLAATEDEIHIERLVLTDYDFQNKTEMYYRFFPNFRPLSSDLKKKLERYIDSSGGNNARD